MKELEEAITLTQLVKKEFKERGMYPGIALSMILGKNTQTSSYWFNKGDNVYPKDIWAIEKHLDLDMGYFFNKRAVLEKQLKGE